LGSAPCHSQQPVYLGGPVPGPLIALHTNSLLGETEALPGVYFAAKKQRLDSLVLTEEPSYKIFIGHSGWGAGQLETEMSQGDWRTVPATAELVFSTADDLWETVLRQIGHTLLKSILRLDDLPPDPSVN
jgi:putative transcriptional regulator